MSGFWNLYSALYSIGHAFATNIDGTHVWPFVYRHYINTTINLFLWTILNFLLTRIKNPLHSKSAKYQFMPIIVGLCLCAHMCAEACMLTYPVFQALHLSCVHHAFLEYAAPCNGDGLLCQSSCRITEEHLVCIMYCVCAKHAHVCLCTCAYWLLIMCMFPSFYSSAAECLFE